VTVERKKAAQYVDIAPPPLTLCSTDGIIFGIFNRCLSTIKSGILRPLGIHGRSKGRCRASEGMAIVFAKELDGMLPREKAGENAPSHDDPLTSHVEILQPGKSPDRPRLDGL